MEAAHRFAKREFFICYHVHRAGMRKPGTRKLNVLCVEREARAERNERTRHVSVMKEFLLDLTILDCLDGAVYGTKRDLTFGKLFCVNVAGRASPRNLLLL